MLRWLIEKLPSGWAIAAGAQNGKRHDHTKSCEQPFHRTPSSAWRASRACSADSAAPPASAVRSGGGETGASGGLRGQPRVQVEQRVARAQAQRALRPCEALPGRPARVSAQPSASALRTLGA